MWFSVSCLNYASFNELVIANLWALPMISCLIFDPLHVDTRLAVCWEQNSIAIDGIHSRVVVCDWRHTLLALTALSFQCIFTSHLIFVVENAFLLVNWILDSFFVGVRILCFIITLFRVKKCPVVVETPRHVLVTIKVIHSHFTSFYKQHYTIIATNDTNTTNR